jgi:hypothetical protein
MMSAVNAQSIPRLVAAMAPRPRRANQEANQQPQNGSSGNEGFVPDWCGA